MLPSFSEVLAVVSLEAMAYRLLYLLSATCNLSAGAALPYTRHDGCCIEAVFYLSASDRY